MYSVSAEFSAAMLQPVIQSKIAGVVDGITFTEADILSGSLRITSQNSQQDEINIGVAASAELEITFLHNLGLDRETLRGKPVVLSYQLLVGETYESVPLGTYYIEEANWTLNGIQCKAYDAMTAFDTEIDPAEALPTTGKAYDFLTWACGKCGISLGMSQAEVEALTNGMIPIWYPEESPAKTYREYVAYLAGALGAFAVINRSGELIMKQYTRLPMATYTETARITGASFSDFVTRYNSYYVQDVITNENQRYKNTGYVGLTMDLGPNPFMQILPTREGIRQAVLSELSNIIFGPYEVKLNIPPIHDLGDCIKFTGGIGDNNYHTVNYICWTYNRQLVLSGYGKNPASASALSKTDLAAQNNQTAIQSLTRRVNEITTSGVVFLSPTIPEIDDIPKTLDPIDDGDEGMVADFNFEVTQEKAPVAVHAVIEIDAETTADDDIYGDCLASITVSSDIGILGTQTEAFGDGLHVLTVDTLKKYFDTGEHNISIELALAGGYAALNKLKLRTAYLETRARVINHEQKTLGFYDGYVAGDTALSNCLVTDLNGCVDCAVNSQMGINAYSEYFLTGQALAYRTHTNGNFWRINHNTASRKWSPLPISYTVEAGETLVPYIVEQVSGSPIYITMIQDLGEGTGLIIASREGVGDSQIRRVDTGAVISHGATILQREGLSGTLYYLSGPYHAGGQNGCKSVLEPAGYIYDISEADPVQMEGWKTLEYAFNDFLGIDENKRDHLGRYPNRVLLNYQTSDGVSYMYIPVERKEGWQRIYAKVKLYQTVEGSDYNFVGIGAGAVVDGRMVETLETTDSTAWTTIYADITELPYVDYIILYGRDGAQGIRSVWLWKENRDDVEEEY